MYLVLATLSVISACVSDALRPSEVFFQQHQASSATALAVAEAAEALPPGPAKELLSSFRPCASCANFERFGEPNDGGYVMCADGLDQGVAGAFSFGVGYDGWGMAVASRYHIPLHEYDCFNPTVPDPCKGCDASFHNQCIIPSGSTPNKTHVTFAQMLRDSGLGAAADRSLLVKLDVEGAELSILAAEPIENLRKVRQMVVEIHEVTNDTEKVAKFLPLVRKMKDAGFVIAHLHGNNHWGMVQFGEYSFPRLLEATYVLAPSGGCTDGLPRHLPEDHRNELWLPEIADPVLPKGDA